MTPYWTKAWNLSPCCRTAANLCDVRRGGARSSKSPDAANAFIRFHHDAGGEQLFAKAGIRLVRDIDISTFIYRSPRGRQRCPIPGG